MQGDIRPENITASRVATRLFYPFSFLILPLGFSGRTSLNFPGTSHQSKVDSSFSGNKLEPDRQKRKHSSRFLVTIHNDLELNGSTATRLSCVIQSLNPRVPYGSHSERNKAAVY